ncbi:MFS transporter [Rubellimicrobium roseum]|nr:MFS transporter [Rubellimicrobium roseum]
MTDPLASPPGRLLTLSVLMLSALTIMANATISPSLPALTAHYADVPGIGTLAGLLLTLPSAAIVLSAGLMGWLADRIDRQAMLLTVGGLYALGGTSGLWVDGLGAMLAGRLVLGVGVAGTMILATTWAADLWQGPARERYLGRQGAAISVGGIVVMLLGGLLASLHWRGAFATYLLVVPVTALALRTLAPHARARRDRPRAVGGTGAVVPWKVFAFVGPLSFLFMTVFYVMPTRLPFLLGELGVRSPAAMGGIMAIMTVTSIPGALSYGRIRRHLGFMAIFALGWGVMALGMGIVALAGNAWVAALGVAVMGAGMGPSMPNYTTYWMATVPPQLRGRASGMLTTAFFAGQFASPLLTAPLVGPLGLQGTFAALAAAEAALAAGLVVLAVREARGAALA